MISIESLIGKTTDGNKCGEAKVTNKTITVINSIIIFSKFNLTCSLLDDNIFIPYKYSEKHCPLVYNRGETGKNLVKVCLMGIFPKNKLWLKH